MDRVTIKVSDSDYMALLVLARPELAGCLSSNPVQSHAAALRAGITALQPSTVNTSLASVQLAVFAGWGINASNITITPQNKATLITIGGACIAFPELRAEQQRTRAGLIAVSCVLGVLLLCGTVLGILFLSRRARWVPLAMQAPHRSPIQPKIPTMPVLICCGCTVQEFAQFVNALRIRPGWQL